MTLRYHWQGFLQQRQPKTILNLYNTPCPTDSTEYPLVDLKADGHVHTRLCNHASGEIEEYVVSALDRGLRRITFLEHLEVGIRYDHRTWLRPGDFAFFFREGRRLAEKYRNKIEIKLGVEVGLNLQAISKIRQRLAEYPWDAIGLSYHFYRHKGRHYNMVSQRPENLQAFTEIGIESVIDDYFTGLIYGLQHLPCTVVCHLDAVLRHCPDRDFTENHRQKISALLQLLQQKGRALEINTSGFALRNEPYPSKWIIHRAVAGGIPLLAGSDAHRPEHVARFFNKVPDILQ